MANTPKVKYIRIRENSSGEYKSVVIVKNDQKNRVDSVEVVYDEPFGTNPAPSVTKVICTFASQNSQKNRKRYVSGVYNFNGSDASGLSYAMTATMYRSNGNPIGKPTTMTTAVTNDPDDTDPVDPTLLDADIFETESPGTDGKYRGQLVILLSNDTNNVVTSVSTTVSPDEATAPNPLNGNITCNYSSTDSNGIKTYIGVIEFSNTSVGAQYTVAAAMKNSANATVGASVKFAAVESESA